MFREMRRKRQALPQEGMDAVLQKGTSGVLAVSGDHGYPYAVPLSYVYDGKAGHKLDGIRRDAKASFCVIDQDQVVPEEYTTYFRSVIVFGQIHEITDDSEKWAAMETLAIKYAPNDTAARREQAIQREWKPLCVLKMDIDCMTGKEAVELVAKKQKKEN